MMMEGNEYDQSVTLAALSESAFKCMLLMSVSGLAISCSCLLHERSLYCTCVTCSVAMAKTFEPTSVTDTTNVFHSSTPLI